MFAVLLLIFLTFVLVPFVEAAGVSVVDEETAVFFFLVFVTKNKNLIY